MRVLAVNGSPRLNKSNTALVLEPYLDGMRDAGAEVEAIVPKKMTIKPCTGDFQCWDTPEGRCHIRDDMDGLIPKMKNAEIWVFAVPVYVPLPGEVQNLLNRMMPLLDSGIVIRGKRMVPHKRDDVKVKTVSLVSSCAFWELENFNEMINTIKRVAEVWEAKFALPILRPHVEVLRMLKAEHLADDVTDAARAAGRQLVKDGRIQQKTAQIVQRPLVSFEDFVARMDVRSRS